MVKRKKKVFVVCKSNPRHKQRQGFSTMAALGTSAELSTPIRLSPDAFVASPLSLAELESTLSSVSASPAIPAVSLFSRWTGQ